MAVSPARTRGSKNRILRSESTSDTDANDGASSAPAQSFTRFQAPASQDTSSFVSPPNASHSRSSTHLSRVQKLLATEEDPPLGQKSQTQETLADHYPDPKPDQPTLDTMRQEITDLRALVQEVTTSHRRFKDRTKDNLRRIHNASNQNVQAVSDHLQQYINDYFNDDPPIRQHNSDDSQDLDDEDADDEDWHDDTHETDDDDEGSAAANAPNPANADANVDANADTNADTNAAGAPHDTTSPPQCNPPAPPAPAAATPAPAPTAAAQPPAQARPMQPPPPPMPHQAYPGHPPFMHAQAPPQAPPFPQHGFPAPPMPPGPPFQGAMPTGPFTAPGQPQPHPFGPFQGNHPHPFMAPNGFTQPVPGLPPQNMATMLLSAVQSSAKSSELKVKDFKKADRNTYSEWLCTLLCQLHGHSKFKAYVTFTAPSILTDSILKIQD